MTWRLSHCQPAQITTQLVLKTRRITKQQNRIHSYVCSTSSSTEDRTGQYQLIVSYLYYPLVDWLQCVVKMRWVWDNDLCSPRCWWIYASNFPLVTKNPERFSNTWEMHWGSTLPYSLVTGQQIWNLFFWVFDPFFPPLLNALYVPDCRDRDSQKQCLKTEMVVHCC
jgi:hypothetical protein